MNLKSDNPFKYKISSKSFDPFPRYSKCMYKKKCSLSIIMYRFLTNPERKTTRKYFFLLLFKGIDKVSKFTQIYLFMWKKYSDI